MHVFPSVSDSCEISYKCMYLYTFFSTVLILEMTDGEQSSKDSDYDEEDTTPSTSSQSEKSQNGDSVPKSTGSQSQ